MLLEHPQMVIDGKSHANLGDIFGTQSTKQNKFCLWMGQQIVLNYCLDVFYTQWNTWIRV